MSEATPNPVWICEEDYQQLKAYLGTSPSSQEMSLSHELQRAQIVPREKLPPHTVTLNSKVSILDLGSNKVMEFKLVMPAHADIKQNKVSILTPMGAALIGFKKGDDVNWKVPSGVKRFRILDVATAEVAK